MATSQLLWLFPSFLFSVQAVATPSVSPRAAYAQRGTNTLQDVFRDHFASFAAEYDSRYSKDLGSFRIERITEPLFNPLLMPSDTFLRAARQVSRIPR